MTKARSPARADMNDRANGGLPSAHPQWRWSLLHKLWCQCCQLQPWPSLLGSLQCRTDCALCLWDAVCFVGGWDQHMANKDIPWGNHGCLPVVTPWHTLQIGLCRSFSHYAWTLALLSSSMWAKDRCTHGLNRLPYRWLGRAMSGYCRPPPPMVP